jgi:parallel beta-helix repeat protein
LARPLLDRATMTLDEARRILDLDPDADPALHQEELLERREKLVRLMNNAPDTAHADRCRRELAEHDEAVAFLKHYRAPGSTSRRVLTGLLAVTLAAGGGSYAFQKIKQENLRKTHAEAERLFLEAERLVDAKDWYLAREKYQRIVQLQPDSSSAAYGLNQVEATIEREKQAFLAEWNHEATTAFAAKRWDQAEAAAKTVLAKYPDDASAREMQQRVVDARKAERIEQALAEGKGKLTARDWDSAVSFAEAALALEANHVEAKALRDEAIAAKHKAAADRLKARELFAKAQAADQGQYDKQLAAWAKEARALEPDNAEIKALFDKVSAYVRIVRVPGDFATPAEALADLDDGNVLTLGEGVWQGPLIVDKPVELRGTGVTVIECPAGQSVAISFGPGAKGAKVAGLTFRHQGTDASTERFSAALVRGGEVAFDSCEFTEASGHGLMVIEGGKASAVRCRFQRNGWDGAAASGVGSRLEIRLSVTGANREHGLDVWDGATADFVGNLCVVNGRNGILIDSGAAANVTGNETRGNREFGLVLSNAQNGRITDNQIEANQMGGMVVRLAAAKIEVVKNRFSGQAPPAMVLEKGLPTEGYRAANELPATDSVTEVVYPEQPTAP